MFLDFTLKQLAPDLSYSILGSDIDHESLAFAQNGVYTRKEIKEVPLAYLGDHWARGTGEIADYVKAKNTLRQNVQWQQFNLLTLPQNFASKFDHIFCRNVFIYFNPSQIKQSSIDLIKHLEPHGFYFTGLSESLNGLNLPLASQGPSIFRHQSIVDAEKAPPMPLAKPGSSSGSSPAAKMPSTTPATPAIPKTKEVLRVLCVDDSPSILTLLKRVLTKEDGFEVVGTAANGIEAATKLKELKPDIMTLDIHMPSQTGIEYLQKNYNGDHPPVVMVSSVSREESDLAIKAMHLGASDYVEKPALANLREVSDEIKRKLRSAYRNQVVYHQKTNLQLDDSFKRTVQITNPQNFVRLIVGQLSDKNKIQSLIKELGRGQPPTFILLDGAKDTLEGFAANMNFPSRTVSEWPSSPLKADELYVADAKKFAANLPKKNKSIPASILVMGEVSPSLKDLLEGWTKAQVLVEDLGPKQNGHSPFKNIQSDIVPATSFAYMSCEFLGRPK
jgi:chemotaxis protein methyltransferase CheR